MNFLQAMQKRYTTKKYDAEQKVNPFKIDNLKAILRLSPSSINSQPWQFSFVSEETTKNALAQTSNHNRDKILACDTVIVLSRFSEIATFENLIQQNLPERSVKYYNDNIKTGTDEQIFAWMEKQVYLALGVLLSACAAIEIDATPMEGIIPHKFDEVLKQSEYATVVAVAIGQRANDDKNQLEFSPKTRRDFEEVIKDI